MRPAWPDRRWCWRSGRGRGCPSARGATPRRSRFAAENSLLLELPRAGLDALRARDPAFAPWLYRALAATISGRLRAGCGRFGERAREIAAGRGAVSERWDPSRAPMDHVLDWRLVHRSEQDMDALFLLFAECVKRPEPWKERPPPTAPVPQPLPAGALSGAPVPEPAPAPWPRWQTWALRCALLHHVLYAFPGPLSAPQQVLFGALELAGADVERAPWSWVGVPGVLVSSGWEWLTTRMASLGLAPYEVIHQPTGSGDMGAEVARMLFIVTASVAGASAWSLRGQARAYPALGRWLHLVARVGDRVRGRCGQALES